MSFEIRGLATATPEHGIQQADAAEMAISLCCQTEQQSRLLKELYRRAGVRHRYSVFVEGSHGRPQHAAPVTQNGQPGGSLETLVVERPPNTPAVQQSFFEPAANADDCGPTTAQRMQMYERHAGPLAEQAAAKALDASSYAPSDITHLVTVSCTGFSTPGVDLSLIRNLGLKSSVTRSHIGFMGCHGAINGLRVAQAYADADPAARVMLCAVELCTLHQQYGWHPDRIVSNALFADGAAAVVGCKADATSLNWNVLATASAVIPETENLMGWQVRDHGFEMMLSPRVPDLIRQTLRPWLCEWLEQYGLTIEAIGSWAIHPGGPRILQGCADAIGFQRGQLSPSQQILAEFGNMSSPTVLFILERLMQHCAELPCVMLAFGPGLSIEVALVVAGQSGERSRVSDP